MMRRVLMGVLMATAATLILAAPTAAALPIDDAQPAAQPLDVVAKGEGIEARLAAPRDRIEAGEPLPFTLTISAARGVSASAPALDAKHGQFEVTDLRTSTHPTPEGSVTDCRFVARSYEAGRLEFPGLTLSYRDAGGAERTLELAPSSVTVATIVSDPFDPAQFRDIKGPIAIDTASPWWWAIAAASVVAAGAALFLLFRHRRAVAARSLSPHLWAMQSLAALELDGLVERGQLHPYWVRLSDIVRQYIERRFDIAAPEQTTKEFLASVGDHPSIAAEHRHLLTDFLKAADMVKFAAHQPAASECARGLAAARGFVEDTTAPAEGGPVAHAREEATR